MYRGQIAVCKMEMTVILSHCLLSSSQEPLKCLFDLEYGRLQFWKQYYVYSAFSNAAIAKMLMKSIHCVRVKEALGVCAHVAILLSSDHGM